MRNVAKSAMLQLLRAYKWAISPLFPPACRYVPTCSEYAMEAVERYGALRGGLKAIARLLRCHPFAKGGYEPVVKHQHEPLSANVLDRTSFWEGHDFSPAAKTFLAPEGPTTNDERPTTHF